MLRFSVRVGESNDYWPKAQAENSFLYFYSGHFYRGALVFISLALNQNWWEGTPCKIG